MRVTEAGLAPLLSPVTRSDVVFVYMMLIVMMPEPASYVMALSAPGLWYVLRPR